MAAQGTTSDPLESPMDAAAFSASFEHLLQQFSQDRVNSTYYRMRCKLDSLRLMSESRPGELCGFTVSLVNRTRHALSSYHDFIDRGSPEPVLDFAKQIVDNRYKKLLDLVALDAKRCLDREVVRERPDLAHWQPHCTEADQLNAVLRYANGARSFMRCSGVLSLNEEHRNAARTFCSRPWTEVHALVEADVRTVSMGLSDPTPFFGLFRRVIEHNPKWTLVSLIRAVRVAAADEVERQALWHQTVATRLEAESRRRYDEEDMRRLEEEEENHRVTQLQAEQLEETHASKIAASLCVLTRQIDDLIIAERGRLDELLSHNPVVAPSVPEERRDNGWELIPEDLENGWVLISEPLMRDWRTDLEEPVTPTPSLADAVASESPSEEWEHVDSDISSFVPEDS